MFQFDHRRVLHGQNYLRARTAGVLVLAILMTVNAFSACAEVRVEADARAVRVDASQASVADVLTALGPSFNVRYRTVMPLQGVVNGSYSGSVERVLSRVLDGYNYVLKRDKVGIEVLIIGKRGESAIPVVDTKPETARSLARQWRTPSLETGP
jgi:hypothetical protein